LPFCRHPDTRKKRSAFLDLDSEAIEDGAHRLAGAAARLVNMTLRPLNWSINAGRRNGTSLCIRHKKFDHALAVMLLLCMPLAMAIGLRPRRPQKKSARAMRDRSLCAVRDGKR
jgi:hypothetical protein